MISAIQRLRLGSGAVIAVPIPPQHSAEGGRVQGAIDRALKELEEQKVTGNEVSGWGNKLPIVV
eukprot:1176032-Prorocentrum_minimum.AAC.1